MKWKDLTWQFCHPPMTDAELRRVEDEIGYPFPEDFRACVMVCHGGQPTPSGFTVRADGMKIGVGVGALMGFQARNDITTHFEWFEIAGDYLEGLVPFADDGGGCFTCFYYPPVPENAPPFVVFWARVISKENEFIYLAPSFSEFVNILSDEPDPALYPPYPDG